MKRLIYVVLTIVAVLLSGAAEAQNIEQMRKTLANRTMDGNNVEVTEDTLTEEAVRVAEGAIAPAKISGYRVVIYFDNGQGANDKASSVLSTFRARYPHINAYLVYESPYFKVSVGDCLTMEEALILMNTFIGDYPKAFPKREDIRLAELQNARAREVIIETPGGESTDGMSATLVP